MTQKYIVFDIETTGLCPVFGNLITCICARDSDGNEFKKSLKNNSEEDLLTKFLFWCVEKKLLGYKIMVTCNGVEFDIPFILLRVFKLKLDIIYPGFYTLFEDFQQVDIQRITSRKVSLNDMAILLKCDLKSGNGINAIKLYYEKRLDELEDYCMDDVKITEEIYNKTK